MARAYLKVYADLLEPPRAVPRLLVSNK
jgi:hypothetical protein